MRRGSITLGDLAGKIAMLAVACSRCQRRGRLRVDLLIERHGDAELPELRPPGGRLPEGRGPLDQRSVRHLLPGAGRSLSLREALRRCVADDSAGNGFSPIAQDERWIRGY